MIDPITIRYIENSLTAALWIENGQILSDLTSFSVQKFKFSI